MNALQEFVAKGNAANVTTLAEKIKAEARAKSYHYARLNEHELHFDEDVFNDFTKRVDGLDFSRATSWVEFFEIAFDAYDEHAADYWG